jgi:hypothetical protein
MALSIQEVFKRIRAQRALADLPANPAYDAASSELYTVINGFCTQHKLTEQELYGAYEEAEAVARLNHRG